MHFPEGASLLVNFEVEKNVIRVLVAEDHTIVREGIKQLIGLAKDLLVVGEASNGEQLLETLRHVPCEVVLLDISMPGVNGLEAIPRIRALNNPPAILVLSMHDEAQMAARALKIGAAGYATKDSDPALLLTAIRKVAAGGVVYLPQVAAEQGGRGSGGRGAACRGRSRAPRTSRSASGKIAMKSTACVMPWPPQPPWASPSCGTWPACVG